MLPIRLQLLAPVVPAQPGVGGTAGTEPAAGGFGALLQAALGGVNRDQIVAQSTEQALTAGAIADVGQVVVAAEQARLSLDLTVAVRNKLLDAYQEIMRMPV